MPEGINLLHPKVLLHCERGMKGRLKHHHIHQCLEMSDTKDIAVILRFECCQILRTEHLPEIYLGLELMTDFGL